MVLAYTYMYIYVYMYIMKHDHCMSWYLCMILYNYEVYFIFVLLSWYFCNYWYTWLRFSLFRLVEKTIQETVSQHLFGQSPLSDREETLTSPSPEGMYCMTYMYAYRANRAYVHVHVHVYSEIYFPNNAEIERMLWVRRTWFCGNTYVQCKCTWYYTCFSMCFMCW